MKNSSPTADRRRRLVLVELNEINFDLVEKYVAAGLQLPALQKLLAGKRIRSSCENAYEQLEPWIQWVSVHTGLSYGEHKVFRLGDIVGTELPQIFEEMEQHGLRVGCVSPMNAANRLSDPAYFIPDPWTQTAPDASWWSRKIAAAVSQAVNDNASARLAFRSVLHLGLAFARFANPRHYGLYARLALGSRGASWRKAMVLDLLLHDLHSALFRLHRPDFTTVFFNAGAHIQHHYMLNAQPVQDGQPWKNPHWYIAESLDPVAEMLRVYDVIVGEYLELPETEVLVATGLSQRPYDRVKYYYRLREHAAFLQSLGVRFRGVAPRMTRDFLVEFEGDQAAAEAQRVLSAVTVANGTGPDLPLFGEIDNRGNSLFVTLTYPDEVTAETVFTHEGTSRPLQAHVSFVAVKNGMHQHDGFAFFTEGLGAFAPANGSHVKELNATIRRFLLARDSASEPAPAAGVRMAAAT